MMVFISNGKLHISTYRGHYQVLTAFLLYLLTYSMEQGPSREAS